MVNAVIMGMFGLGGTELIVIMLIVLLLFGGKKIPEMMKGLGRGIKDFKDASNGTDAAKDKEDTKTETKL